MKIVCFDLQFLVYISRSVASDAETKGILIYFYFMKQPSKDPLHGITLKEIVEKLEAHYGFDTLGDLINIKCFRENPSVKSSLTFLRKTDWARKKVEELYLKTGFETI